MKKLTRSSLKGVLKGGSFLKTKTRCFGSSLQEKIAHKKGQVCLLKPLLETPCGLDRVSSSIPRHLGRRQKQETQSKNRVWRGAMLGNAHQIGIWSTRYQGSCCTNVMQLPEGTRLTPKSLTPMKTVRASSLLKLSCFLRSLKKPEKLPVQH